MVVDGGAVAGVSTTLMKIRVLGFADWERLSRVPSFGRLLMSAPLEPGDLPKRDPAPIRDAGL